MLLFFGMFLRIYRPRLLHHLAFITDRVAGFSDTEGDTSFR